MITIDDRTLPDRSPDVLRALAAGHAGRLRRRRRQRAVGLGTAALVVLLLAAVAGEPHVEVRATRPAEPGTVEELVGASPVPGLPDVADDVPRVTPGRPGEKEEPRTTSTTTTTVAPAAKADAPKAAGPHTRLLFTRTSGGLWELSLDDGSLRKVHEYGTAGRWSPDGRRIVTSTGNGLALIDAASGERTVLFEHDVLKDEDVYTPAWLNGSSIVFQWNRKNGVTTWTYELWAIDVESREMRRLRAGAEPSVSRDGRILYSCDNGEWCLTDADGADLGVVTNSLQLTSAVLSPDGRFVTGYRPGPSGTDLVVQQVDGWGKRVLVSGWSFGRPAWFPDGSRVAFTPKPTHSLEPEGEPGIYSVRADGTDVRRHTDAGSAEDYSPDLVHAP